MKYGRAIRLVRSTRKMSQKDLARRASLDPSYVSLIEKDLRTPSVEVLERISDALRVPFHLLTLLSSERKDLESISPDQATYLGKELLNILIEAESEQDKS